MEKGKKQKKKYGKGKGDRFLSRNKRKIMINSVNYSLKQHKIKDLNIMRIIMVKIKMVYVTHNSISIKVEE